MQFTVLIASLVSAAAFTPARVSTRSGALKMGFESEIGAQAPLGFFDPLGLLKDAGINLISSDFILANICIHRSS
jgi:hypothetical protein